MYMYVVAGWPYATVTYVYPTGDGVPNLIWPFVPCPGGCVGGGLHSARQCRQAGRGQPYILGWKQQVRKCPLHFLISLAYHDNIIYTCTKYLCHITVYADMPIHTCRCIHTYIIVTCHSLTLIGVQETHGWVYPNGYCVTNLFVRDPLSSSGYPMIIYTRPVADNVCTCIKALVARQWLTNILHHNHTCKTVHTISLNFAHLINAQVYSTTCSCVAWLGGGLRLSHCCAQ